MIYDPTDKKVWKAKDSDSMFAPLEVLPVDGGTADQKKAAKKGAKTVETRYITNETSSDLIKLIGAEAYIEAVKQVSSHPLFKSLVDSGIQRALGTSDPIFALRAIATRPTLPVAVASILADNIYTGAAMSMAKSIEIEHEDKEVEGMSKKEKAKALSHFDSGCNVRRTTARSAPPLARPRRRAAHPSLTPARWRLDCSVCSATCPRARR